MKITLNILGGLLIAGLVVAWVVTLMAPKSPQPPSDLEPYTPKPVPPTQPPSDLEPYTPNPVPPINLSAGSVPIPNGACFIVDVLPANAQLPPKGFEPDENLQSIIPDGIVPKGYREENSCSDGKGRSKKSWDMRVTQHSCYAISPGNLSADFVGWCNGIREYQP